MPIVMDCNLLSDGTQVVSQRKLEFGQEKFLEVIDGYEEMAINGAPNGVAEIIWNGTGGSDTGGDWTHTGQGTEESYANYSGTNGLDSGVCLKDQTSVFEYGENTSIDSNYDQISFWMQPKAYPKGSELTVSWQTQADVTIGNVLNISSYVSNFDFDIWQKVTIPIVDFNLNETQVAKVTLTYAGKDGQHFYFDDIELHNTSASGPFVFRMASDGYTYSVSAVRLYIATNNAEWTSGAFGNIEGGLENGLLLRYYNTVTSKTLWSINFKNNIDLYGRMVSINNVDFFDDEHIETFVLTPTPTSESIEITSNMALDIVVRDNLSDLNSLRAFVQYGKEVI